MLPVNLKKIAKFLLDLEGNLVRIAVFQIKMRNPINFRNPSPREPISPNSVPGVNYGHSEQIETGDLGWNISDLSTAIH